MAGLETCRLCYLVTARRQPSPDRPSHRRAGRNNNNGDASSGSCWREDKASSAESSRRFNQRRGEAPLPDLFCSTGRYSLTCSKKSRNKQRTSQEEGLAPAYQGNNILDESVDL